MTKARTRKLGTSNLSTSLTSFTDFVLSNGLSRLAVAKKILDQYCTGYSRSRDYYRRFRETLTDLHASAAPVSELPERLRAVALVREQINYQHLARGYLRFWASTFQETGGKWTPPAKVGWSTGHLTVKVNPEVGVISEGASHYLKLYTKEVQPSSDQVQLILHLMQVALWTDETRPVVALLDVRRGRVFEATNYDKRYEPLLRGEALSLVGMCRMLDAEEPSEDQDKPA